MRLKGRIRRGEADLTDPVIAAFAARHGLEAAPPKAPKTEEPKAASKRKARTRKAETAAA